MSEQTTRTIEECRLEDIYELAARAREDDVEVQPRPESQWYRVDSVAMACLWWPQNRRNTARLSHCWVAEEARGEGLGEALVRRRIADARSAGADVIDTYAYRRDLFEKLGFEAGKEYPMGTTHMALETGETDD